MTKPRLRPARLALLLAAVAIAPLIPAGAATTEAPVLKLSVVLLNPSTGEVVACDDAASLTLVQAQACVEMTPIVRVPVSSSSSSNEQIIGWWSRTTYSDHISESCGRYRAQDGHISCQIAFGGSRYVNWIGLIYCGCSDPEYTTTGLIHNYGMGNTLWRYGAFRNNAFVGTGDAGCWDGRNEPRTTTGVTGSMYVYEPTIQTPCRITWDDLKGTWGVSVDYRRTSEDANKQNAHTHATVRTGK